MPELPEVETVKNELLPYVTGRRITGVTLFWNGIVRQPSPAEFQARTKGQPITKLTRRGKYLLFNLGSGDSLIVHLKMTGSLLVNQNSAEAPQYTRATIHLDNGTDIFFRDPRKFGRLWLVTKPSDVTGKLGPEPLGDNFTLEFLTRNLKSRKAPIKALLLDQNLIAGIGNMYADEALFAAGIHPHKPGNELSNDEIERLYNAILRILQTAIQDKGASISNYFRPDGTMGTAHSRFSVAHCGGKPCPTCGTTIERTTTRNRGTYYCPRCQPQTDQKKLNKRCD